MCALRTAVRTCCGLALAGLFITPASASHFSKTSKQHTSFGVSQYNYTLVDPDPFYSGEMIIMLNPNHLTQTAAVIAYGADNRTFLACVVDVVRPHEVSEIDDDNFRTLAGLPADGSGDIRLYIETIWAPNTGVKVGSSRIRQADGLGGRISSEKDVVNGVLAHPRLFSLPSNSVVAGQKQAAIDCVCDELALQGKNGNTFTSFGIACP